MITFQVKIMKITLPFIAPFNKCVPNSFIITHKHLAPFEEPSETAGYSDDHFWLEFGQTFWSFPCDQAQNTNDVRGQRTENAASTGIFLHCLYTNVQFSFETLTTKVHSQHLFHFNLMKNIIVNIRQMSITMEGKKCKLWL